jgi:uncharacterized membrane protein
MSSRHTITVPAVTAHLLGVVAGVVMCAARPSWAIAALGLALVVYLPGRALVGVVRVGEIADTWIARFAGLAVGVVLYQLAGAVASVLGPHLGVDRPLDTACQLFAAAALGAGTAPLRRRHGTATLTLPSARHWRFAALAAALPAGAALGAARLNATGATGLARFVLIASIAALLVASAAAFGAGAHRRLTAITATIYAAGLAVMWSTTLRGATVFGWDIQRESSVARATVAAGRWTAPAGGDAYASMLSITALPAQIHALTGFTTDTVLRVLYPVLFAAVPVIVLRVLLQHASIRSSVLAVMLFVISSRAFPRQFPAIARQEVALFLFAAGIAIVMDRGTVRTVRRRAVAAAILGGIAFTHYTTAYATVFLLVVAWVVGAALTARQRSQRRGFTLTIGVVASVAACVIGWNLLLVPSGVVFDRPSEQVSQTGLEVLGGDEDATLVDRWLRGANARIGSVDEYGERVVDSFDGELFWMRPDPSITTATVTDRRAPTEAGHIPEAARLWQRSYLATTQLLVLLLSGATLWVLWRTARRRHAIPVELLGAVFAALALNTLLRISGWAGQFYNPERGALHNALLLALPVALLLDRFGPRMRRACALAAVLAVAGTATTTWGAAPLLVGGNPPAAVAAQGEDVERFLLTEDELAGARYLSDRVGRDAVIQADRYGQLRLLHEVAQSRYAWVPVYHPAAIHAGAYVYSSRANTVEGRARGKDRDLLAIYSSFIGALDDARSIVYTNDDVRIHR